MSQTEDALANLRAIKSGEDPRRTEVANSIEVIPFEDLERRAAGPLRDGDQIYHDFVDVVNAVEPEHPYLDDPYPATYSDFEFSYCRKSSNVWARCGPRSNKVAKFARDKHAMTRMKEGRYYAVLVHEATHITEGRHSAGSLHNPRFWRQMADNCVKLIHSGEFNIDVQRFVSHARNDPNASMTDRRSLTVEEQKQAVEDRILQQL